MRKALLTLTACLWVALAAGKADACSGSPGKFHFHPAGDYWQWGFVFAGTVTEIVSVPVEYGEGEARRTYTERIARFEAEEWFRGERGRTVEVLSGQTSMCVYDYRQGGRYFVYARRSSDGRLRASIFSRTRPLAEAADDLAYAREIARGEEGARIIGLVQRVSRQHAHEGWSVTPVAGAAVSVEGSNGQRWDALTDARGQFEVRGARPGTFRVRARLAEKLRVSEFDETVYVPREGEGWCYAGVVFNATSLGAVAGRVVGAGGEPVPLLMLDLLPAAARSGLARPPFFTATSNEDGEYKFDHVPPGRYLLAVNPENHVGRKLPAYPRSYYPGVLDAASAAVIDVGENQTKRTKDFRVPPPLRERTLSGTVVAEDGTPYGRARVLLIDLDYRGPSSLEAEAGESGRFTIKGYESFRYCIQAIDNAGAGASGAPRFSLPVRLPASGDVRDLRLVVSPEMRVSHCYDPTR